MNHVSIIGNLTKAPDVRKTQSGLTCASFSVAVQRPKDKNGVVGTDFISCKAWGKTAEVCERYLDKGRKVAVIGHITTGSYEKNGQKHYTTDVTVDKIEFLTPRSDAQTATETVTNPETGETMPAFESGSPDDDDQLPF